MAWITAWIDDETDEINPNVRQTVADHCAHVATMLRHYLPFVDDEIYDEALDQVFDTEDACNDEDLREH